MVTFHNTPRIIQVQPINEYNSGDGWKEANATTTNQVRPNNEINTGDLFLLRQKY